MATIISQHSHIDYSFISKAVESGDGADVIDALREKLALKEPLGIIHPDYLEYHPRQLATNAGPPYNNPKAYQAIIDVTITFIAYLNLFVKERTYEASRHLTNTTREQLPNILTDVKRLYEILLVRDLTREELVQAIYASEFAIRLHLNGKIRFVNIYSKLHLEMSRVLFSHYHASFKQTMSEPWMFSLPTIKAGGRLIRDVWVNKQQNRGGYCFAFDISKLDLSQSNETLEKFYFDMLEELIDSEDSFRFVKPHSSRVPDGDVLPEIDGNKFIFRSKVVNIKADLIKQQPSGFLNL